MNLNYCPKSCLMALAIIMSIVFPIGCKQEPKRVEVVKNYLSGEISRRYYTINGKKEGTMTDFYPGGNLKAERLFENDIEVGKTTMYYKSGKIKEVQYFKDGKVHGGDTIFYEDGKPEMVITYNTGLKDGYVRKFGTDGTLLYEAKYANEVLVEVQGEKINLDSLQKKKDEEVQ